MGEISRWEEFYAALDYQSAYGESYIYETEIINLMNDLLGAMENQDISAVMAIDFGAAFHTVDDEVLLDVLKINFGV